MPRIYHETRPLPNIPDRFGEQNWRRFERVIVEFVQKFPQPVIFVPRNIAPVTAIARLRDAVRAFLHPDNNWASEVDPAVLFTYWPQVSIRQLKDNQVFIGMDKEMSQLSHEDNLKQIKENVFVDGLNEELFFAALCCKHHEIITEPLTAINVTPELVRQAEERYPNAPLVMVSEYTYTIV